MSAAVTRLRDNKLELTSFSEKLSKELDECVEEGKRYAKELIDVEEHAKANGLEVPSKDLHALMACIDEAKEIVKKFTIDVLEGSHTAMSHSKKGYQSLTRALNTASKTAKVVAKTDKSLIVAVKDLGPLEKAIVTRIANENVLEHNHDKDRTVNDTIATKGMLRLAATDPKPIGDLIKKRIISDHFKRTEKALKQEGRKSIASIVDSDVRDELEKHVKLLLAQFDKHVPIKKFFQKPKDIPDTEEDDKTLMNEVKDFNRTEPFRI